MDLHNLENIRSLDMERRTGKPMFLSTIQHVRQSRQRQQHDFGIMQEQQTGEGIDTLGFQLVDGVMWIGPKVETKA